MDWTPYRQLTNDELIRTAHTNQDALTTSNLERELLNRLTAQDDWETIFDLERELLNRLTAQDDWETIFDLIKDTYANNPKQAAEDLPDTLEGVASLECIGNLREIAGVLQEHNIDDIKVLREKLERADKFYDIAREGGEAFSMLAKLAETSQ